MEKIVLKSPSIIYEKQIMSYKKDFEDRSEHLAGCGTLEKRSRIEDWLDDIEKFSSQETCPDGYVPSSTYLAIRESDDILVGIIDFRHHIDHPILSSWGGHIGYSVRYDKRNKGYAKQMLGEVLKLCRLKGLEKILLTCDQQNVFSKKVILHHGGQYEGNLSVDNAIIERYWIHL